MDAILLVAAERGSSAWSWPPGETVPRPPAEMGAKWCEDRTRGQAAG